MISKIFIILLFFYCFSAYALINCNSNPSHFTSLRSSGNPLHLYQVQDQDGLGTCYANSLSTMLYTHIGKQISAHHIAAVTGMKEQGISYFGKTRKRAKALVSRNGKFMNIEEAGRLCDALEAIKDRVTMCKREDVFSETLITDQGSNQKRLHNALSKIYTNSAQLVDLGPNEVKKLSQTLKSIRDDFYKEESNSTTLEFCRLQLQDLLNDSNPPIDDSKNSLGIFLESTCINLDNEIKSLERRKKILISKQTRSGKASFEEIKAIDKKVLKLNSRLKTLGSVNKIGKQRKTCNLNESIINAKNNYLKDLYQNFNSKGVAKRLGQKHDDTAEETFVDGSFKEPIQNFLKSFTPIDGDKTWPVEIFQKEGVDIKDKEFKALFSNDINMVIPKRCAQSSLMNLEQGTVNYYDEKLKLSGLCLDTKTTKSIIEVVNALGLKSDDKSDPLDNMNRIFAGLNKSYDDYLMGIINPSCLELGKGVIRDEYADLKCEETKFFTASNEQLTNMWNSMSKDEKIDLIIKATQTVIKDKDIDKVKTELLKQDLSEKSEFFKALMINKKPLSDRFYNSNPIQQKMKFSLELQRMNKIVSETINSGKPVEVSLCSKVLLTKSSSFQDRSNCNGVALPDKSGPHSVMIIGQRCSKTGTIEYQIQNSWGTSCSSTDYECNPNQGTMWIPEKQLINNTISISVLK